MMKISKELIFSVYSKSPRGNIRGSREENMKYVDVVLSMGKYMFVTLTTKVLDRNISSP